MKGTRVFIAAMLLTAAVCAVVLLLRSGGGGRTVNVYRNGECVYSACLDGVAEPYEYTVAGENGLFNVLLITPEGVSVIRADCPDGVCVRTGVISDGTIPIICLPARLSVAVETDSALDIDSISR